MPSGRRKLPTKEQTSGMDPEFLLSLAKNIPPNPMTGKQELSDVFKYMSQHPEDMQKLMDQVDGSELQNPTDYSDYDFKSLAKSIRPQSIWTMQMEDMGFVDESGNSINGDRIRGDNAGAQRSFLIYVFDEKGSYRTIEQIIGEVTAGQVLKILQQTMANPTAPLEAALPSFFAISLRFQQFAPTISPWLNSLPKQFIWRFETEKESLEVASSIAELNEKGFEFYYTRSADFKQQGNDAFKRKERKRAVEAYSKAIDELFEAINFANMEGDVDSKSRAKTASAVCYANRAAAWCLEGPGMNAKKAIEDGELSEKMDKTYAKAYYRQAKAYTILQQPTLAENVLIRGLSLPELENDKSLVDFLIDLQTGGKGLPQDEGDFKQWLLDQFVNDKKPRLTNVSNLNGEWKRRCDALSEKFKKQRDGN